jgi:hypothetical protein
MKAISRFTILVLGSALVLACAHATTITTYNDPTAWQNATAPGYQTVTFEGLTTPGGATTYNSATGLTATGVEFIGYTSSGVSAGTVIDTSAFPWFNDGSGDAFIQTTDRPNSGSPLPYINIVLPANVTALSMDLFTASPQALNYTISVAGNQYAVPTFSQPTLAFFGITSDTAISSVQLTLAGTTFNSGSQALLDNFRFGGSGGSGGSDVTAAPEAGTYLLIGTGLIGLVLLRKRLNRNPTAL